MLHGILYDQNDIPVNNMLFENGFINVDPFKDWLRIESGGLYSFYEDMGSSELNGILGMVCDELSNEDRWTCDDFHHSWKFTYGMMRRLETQLTEACERNYRYQSWY